MNKPKLKNFLFKKGLKSYFNHLNKYYKQVELKEAQKNAYKEHNLQQSLIITPRYKEYIKAIRRKSDGKIVYVVKRKFSKDKIYNSPIEK